MTDAGLTALFGAIQAAAGGKNFAAEIGSGADAPQLVTVPHNHVALDLSPFVEAWERVLPAPRRRRGVFKAETLISLMDWAVTNIDAPLAEAPLPLGIPTPADGEPPMQRETKPQVTFYAEGLAALGKEWRTPDLRLSVIGNYSTRDAPAWHDFRGEYKFQMSAQWNDWAKHNMVQMDQGQFAAFLEDHQIDIAMPPAPEEMDVVAQTFMRAFENVRVADPLDMIKLSRGLDLFVKYTVSESRNYQTGEGGLTFKEEQSTTTGEKLVVPPLFFINVPVFFDGGSHLIPVRLRYRIAQGGVKWHYEILRPEFYVADVFMASLDFLKQHNHVTIMGKPDVPKQVGPVRPLLVTDKVGVQIEPRWPANNRGSSDE
jgi:hypothetical protein